jgi:recombination associated protein RdgC
MWFKNLQLFRLLENPPTEVDVLEEALAKQAFRDCGSLEFSTEGWVSPLGLGGETLVHAVGGFQLVCACRQEKLLPPSVVGELVAAEVLELERQQGGRRLPRRDRQAVKEGILNRLLPAALPKNRRTWMVIDPRGGWLWIDSSSRARAEEQVTLLRESLGSLRVVPPEASVSPASRLSRWLAGEGLPEAFALGDQCELRDPLEQHRVVRCRGLDLAEEEVQAHLAAGMQATRLALNWHDRVAFTVDAELSIRGLQFLDEVRDQLQDVVAETDAERFDADFAIMSHELASLVPELLEGSGIQRPT